MNAIPAALACALALSLTSAAAAAQDLVQTAGKNAKVVLENDKVRVIELNMPPKGSTGVHSHQDNLVVFLSGGTAHQTTIDPKTGKEVVKDTQRKPGEVVWSGPVKHDTVNSGNAPVRTLVIELK